MLERMVRKYGYLWNPCLFTRYTIYGYYFFGRAATGSYAGAGYLLATLDTSGTVANYARWLDLDEAITRTTWSQGGATFKRYVDGFLRRE